MSEEESLAVLQAQLVATLLAGGPLPPGVDVGAAAVQSGVPLAKASIACSRSSSLTGRDSQPLARNSPSVAGRLIVVPSRNQVGRV